MKFLTIRQPWASLIAVGAKTIETRPFSTKYRGPLAIHAGKALASGEPYLSDVTLAEAIVAGGLAREIVRAPSGAVKISYRSDLPLGAVVAVCDLVDVVPMVELWPSAPCMYVGNDEPMTLWRSGRVGPGVLWQGQQVEDQRPFGDFTPGRYAWLLDNVRPVEPVPMKGAQGLRDVPADVLARIEAP